jgi:uncharacterized protein (DUF1778 family)
MATLVNHSIESARLNCRISSSIKQRAEEAAQLLGQSITAFTEAALAEKAREVLEQHEKILLSQRDFERFAAAINKPAPPTPALVRAMRKYETQRDADSTDNW